MKITFEFVSPAYAAELLKANTRNRTLRKTLVSRYADDMKNGRWLETHQGIAFSDKGELLDGQHRLEAIVESGCGQWMMIARDVPETSQIAIDDHARRTVADSVSIELGEKVDRRDSSAVIVLVTDGGFHNGVTKKKVVELLAETESARRFVVPRFASHQKGISTAPVVGACVLAWFYANDIDRLGYFMECLCGREMPTTPSDRAAVSLREWLLKTNVLGGSMRREAYMKTQRAIKAFMNGEPLMKLIGASVYQWPLENPVRR